MSFSTAVLLTIFNILQAQDWTMYLRDPSHSSYNPTESLLSRANVSDLRPLWKFTVGGTISTGVTYFHGVLFFGAWDGNLHAVEAATGVLLWTQYLGKAPDPANRQCGVGIGIAAQPTVSGDVVYAAGGDSSVYALNRHTGEILWKVPLADPLLGAFIWSSVLRSGDALYVGIASLADCPLVRGGVARIALNNPSQPLIRYFVPQDAVGASVWSTPALDEEAGVLYVTTGNAENDVQDEAQGIWGSALLALDATTLEIQAHFFLPLQSDDVDADWGSSPLLFQNRDGRRYVAASGKTGVMWVLNRRDLSPAWSANLALGCIAPELGCGALSTPAFDGQTLFAAAGVSELYPDYTGCVYAFDPSGPTLLWSYGADGVVIAPVTITPGLVHVPTTEGMVILDSATGQELWRDWEGSSGLYGQAVVANGMIFCSYINGYLIAWSVTEPQRVPLPAD
jgi:outer membrane protein assembly factor BamB